MVTYLLINIISMLFSQWIVQLPGNVLLCKRKIAYTLYTLLRYANDTTHCSIFDVSAATYSCNGIVC